MNRLSIETRDLGRRFGEDWAVRHLDLRVPEGAIFGLLGRGGAGKSTTVRMLLGMLNPHEGEMRLAGVDPMRDHAEAVRDVGYAGEDMGPSPGWTVRRVLDFSSWVYDDWDSGRAEALRGEFALPLDKRVDGLLCGQRSRLGLLLALVRRPKLLLLDEPFRGLDGAVRNEIAHRLVDVLPNSRSTVFVTSSRIQDLDWIVDHMAVIHDGRIRFTGTFEEFRVSIRRVRLVARAATLELSSFPWVRSARNVGNDRQVVVLDYSHEHLKTLKAAGYEIESVETMTSEEVSSEYLGQQGDVAAA
jgi:ABC-2 type transport system ATP-binding protein